MQAVQRATCGATEPSDASARGPVAERSGCGPAPRAGREGGPRGDGSGEAVHGRQQFWSRRSTDGPAAAGAQGFAFGPEGGDPEDRRNVPIVEIRPLGSTLGGRSPRRGHQKENEKKDASLPCQGKSHVKLEERHFPNDVQMSVHHSWGGGVCLKNQTVSPKKGR